MTAFALVTGASAGLGLALAEALARQGRALMLLARSKEQLHQIANELQRRFGVEVLVRACDLSKPLQVTGLIQELEESGLAIDLLVNNAGLGTAGAFLAQEWADEKQELEVNILALTQLCHGIGGLMARQSGGQILNVASAAAFQPGPWMSSYYASKAYVLNFSEGLREELNVHPHHPLPTKIKICYNTTTQQKSKITKRTITNQSHSKSKERQGKT